MKDDKSEQLSVNTIYDRLLDAYGPQHWWPAQTPFEVMIGAVLTQSAAWTNVEKAITNLKKAQALSPGAIRNMPFSELSGLIKPSGYYNVKARKLKSLVYWLGENYSDDIEQMSAVKSNKLREELLAVYGIGPETADSILLYALGKPLFVIDAYTKRIFSRIGLTNEDDSYNYYQKLFMANLATDVIVFNEYHALIVKHAKEACNKKPVCGGCCLSQICSHSGKI
ncbi:MAG TPA: endonuclease [Dehalococcoidia bacterium]|nr:endonuclease [Dehalococcoidia bacterium]